MRLANNYAQAREMLDRMVRGETFTPEDEELLRKLGSSAVEYTSPDAQKRVREMVQSHAERLSLAAERVKEAQNRFFNENLSLSDPEIAPALKSAVDDVIRNGGADLSSPQIKQLIEVIQGRLTELRNKRYENMGKGPIKSPVVLGEEDVKTLLDEVEKLASDRQRLDDALSRGIMSVRVARIAPIANSLRSNQTRFVGVGGKSGYGWVYKAGEELYQKGRNEWITESRIELLKRSFYLMFAAFASVASTSFLRYVMRASGATV